MMTPMAQAKQFLEFISEQGSIRELRCFSNQSTPDKKDVWAGHYDDTTKMAQGSAFMTTKNRAEAVYYSLNTVKPERAFEERNIIYSHRHRTVQGAHIAARELYLVDCDPKRSDDCRKLSATAAEKARATLLAQLVHEYLAVYGFPEPIIMDSGNGAALLYKGARSEPESTQYYWAQCLLHLFEHFADFEGASVDRAVHDPNRISRMPGTWNRKGPDTPERPHRMAQVISYPEVWEPIRTELLMKLAENAKGELTGKGFDAPRPPPALEVSSKRVQRVVKSVLEDLIEEYPESFTLHQVSERPDGVYIALSECPFKGAEHTGQFVGLGKSCIIVNRHTAQIGFKCFSDDCTDYTFGALMRLIEEQYGEPPWLSYWEEIMPVEDGPELPYIKYVRKSAWDWPLEALVNTMDLTYTDVETEFLNCALITDQQLETCGNPHREAMRAWAQRVVDCRDLDAASSLIGQRGINCIAFPSSGPLTDAEVDALLAEIQHPVELRWVA